MRRLAALLAVAALCLFGAAGCGGGDKKPVTPLDDALGYFAKDAPFVAAVETDPDGPQVKQAVSLVRPPPVGGLPPPRLEQLRRFRFLPSRRDLRPLLGPPPVTGLTKP